MVLISKKISKNYAFEFSAFHKIRKFKDGVTVCNSSINLDLYNADHNPQLQIILVLINFKIFEINIYNVNHEEEKAWDRISDKNLNKF